MSEQQEQKGQRFRGWEGHIVELVEPRPTPGDWLVEEVHGPYRGKRYVQNIRVRGATGGYTRC